MAAAILRCAKRPRRELIVGASGRQLVLLHSLAPAAFERIMTRNVEREHFREEPLDPTPGNLRQPMPDWTGVTGGWKQGDASPSGSGPARAAMAGGSAAALTTLAVTIAGMLARATARR